MLIIILAVLFSLILLGMPIALAMLGASVISIISLDIPLNVLAQRVSSGVESFPLLAIPLFMLAGGIMNKSGISERLFDFTRSLVGHLRGGLAHVNVLSSVLMAGISGSSLADCAATTRVMVPQMERNGYDRGFSVALTASSATLSPIIPPSILMVVYGWQANISIGDLFIAGILPGLLIAFLLTLLITGISIVKQYPKDEGFQRSRVVSYFKKSVWALLMPVLIIVGFRMGIFTVTEVAAVAVAYSFFVGKFVYRTLSWKDMGELLVSTSREAASILIIIAASAPLAWSLSILQAPQEVVTWITGLTDDPLMVLLLLNLALLVIGMFMETIAVIIVLVPILIPLLNALDISLVHFGIIMLFNLLIGQITPPLGVLMFVSCNIAKLSTLQFLRSSLPFFLVLLLALLVITYVPGLSLAFIN
ncbi:MULTISPECIES: TRAP transporter large permease [Halomonadaceae]|uniref:TRAP transporter large permease protein n=1 Tax=Vreelandella neptunia TaxID=115551 RepID=A0ABS9SC09_9GAMM|nr:MULTISPECIES: TRAP transporter large permease [Halomonas]MCH4813640.1 TRAP transporter large permease [Halomonas neptunia]|tara:strand:+ start:66984 stop:68246 length:1263 start_codon:yes stop_codon:yes gene_type:complete